MSEKKENEKIITQYNEIHGNAVAKSIENVFGKIALERNGDHLYLFRTQLADTICKIDEIISETEFISRSDLI